MGKVREGMRLAPAGAVAGAVALAALFLYVNKPFYHDDAYISLRYARNLLAGDGLVWNPGERVQGYTNFLHVGVVSLLGLAGADLVWASRAVGLGAYGALALLALAGGWRLARDESERALAWLPGVFVLASCPLIVWALGGLEGTLLALLVWAGCVLFIAGVEDEGRGRGRLGGSGVCLALASLTRPDAVVFAGVAFLWLLAGYKNKKVPLGSLLAFAAPGLAIGGGYLAWQVGYYGDPVPNTFYAKASGFSWDRVLMGMEYAVAYAARPPYLPLLAGAAGAWAAAAGRWTARLSFLALCCGGYLAFIVFVGGDHMQAFRLMVPLVAPLGCIVWLSLAGLAGAPTRGAPAARRWVAPAAAAGALALCGAQFFSKDLNPRREDPASFVGTIIGKHISRAWPAGSLVALNTAGSTPYYASGHRYIDMLGLNDRHIARRRIEKIELPWQRVPGHLKGDGAYVLDRRPDYIIVGRAEGTAISEPWFLSDLEMGRDPRFARDYVPREVRLGPRGEVVAGGGIRFLYYQRLARQP